MIHSEEAALHTPVVRQKLLQRIGRRSKEQIDRPGVVELEELSRLTRNREHGMKMRTVRQPFTHLLRPLSLTGSETTRTMPVTTRTRKPLKVVTSYTLRSVEPEFTMSAMGDVVESRIFLLTQSSRPEIAPLAQNVIDCRFDAAIMNTVFKSATNKPRDSPTALIEDFRSTSEDRHRHREAPLRIGIVG